MSDPWVPFHVALAMVTQSIGSNVLAWDELPRLLKDGHVRAIAECTDVDEVTGERLRSYDTTLPKEWWSRPKRFHRLAINGRLFLMVEKEERYEDEGYWFYVKCTYDRVRIFKPDLEKQLAPSSAISTTASEQSDRQIPIASSAGLGRRGPKAEKFEAVVEAMRLIPRAKLEAMVEKEMAYDFCASRDTCRRARKLVLSEFVDK